MARLTEMGQRYFGFPRWPLVTRQRYEHLKLENYSLRDALREANQEIRRLRHALAAKTRR